MFPFWFKLAFPDAGRLREDSVEIPLDSNVETFDEVELFMQTVGISEVIGPGQHVLKTIKRHLESPADFPESKDEVQVAYHSLTICSHSSVSIGLKVFSSSRLRPTYARSDVLFIGFLVSRHNVVCIHNNYFNVAN